MPKPLLPPSASANVSTITRRVTSGIRYRYHPPSASRVSVPGRQDAVNTRQCRCHRRCFSQLTPKPLARLHDRRDIDAIFSPRSSSITLHSNRNRTKDDKNRNKVVDQPGQTVKYDLPPGTEGGRDHKPPDERVVKLGKTLRRLSPLLPNILINPLPTDMLSPQITLHLFPSTHPHLPNVKGRVLYRAALWTVPVAWSSLPLLGNVKLQILSERMVRADSALCCDHPYNDAAVDCGEERLVVRWKTSHNTPSGTSSSPSSSTSSASDLNTSGSNLSTSRSGVNKSLSTLLGGDAPIFLPGKEGRFEGLFIFAFDEKGRIAGHTIEHADQADGWDRTAKFVTLTDWLLGKARGSLGEAAAPSLAAQGYHHHQAHASRRAYYRGDEGYGAKGGGLCYHDGMR